MKTLKGKPVISGKAHGKAMITRMPMNFTAALTKPQNAIPGMRAVVQDRHHNLYKKNLKGTILIFPACIGSTYTGMVLLELMYSGSAPAAIIVQRADPLLVSGTVLADVWFDRGIPIVEYESDDIYEHIQSGRKVEVNGETGEIKIL